jgi:hypothetical protein
MASVAFSVRFPPSVADRMDALAAEQQWSRSELVSKMISAAAAEDRREIIDTPPAGRPTEKLNLRLDRETVAHLTRLAGDVPSAEFLRRLVVRTLVAVEGARGPAHQPGPAAQRSRRRQASYRGERQPRVIAISDLRPLIVLLTILGVVALVAFIVWRLRRGSDPDPTSPSPLPPHKDSARPTDLARPST